MFERCSAQIPRSVVNAIEFRFGKCSELMATSSMRSGAKMKHEGRERVLGDLTNEGTRRATETVQRDATGPPPLRPFLRWAGSKRLLLRQLTPLVPERFGTYIEPFLGGGSLFLSVKPERAIVGDSLGPLALTWDLVRNDPDALLAKLSTWRLDRETYLSVREYSPADPIERAAQFIFLNRGAYGGLWRLNRKGRFNVPWSDPKTDSAIDSANFKAISAYMRLSDISLQCADFSALTAKASAGDFVFLDPPYSKGRQERPFIHYNESLFSWEDQVRLSHEAHRLRGVGATVVITNSTHPDVKELYSGFSCNDVTRHSSLGSHVDSSRQITERIFFSG